MELTQESTHTAEPLENPRLWKLYIQLDAQALQVLLLCITDQSVSRFHTIGLDTTVEPDRALQEAVYSSPLLLADYERVTVCVRTSAYICVDSGLPEQTLRNAAEIAHITDDDTVTMIDPIPGTSISTVWTMPEARYNFLSRTFPSAQILHHITPLITYFSRKSSLGNHGKTYAHIQAGNPAQVDLISFDSTGTPALIVTKEANTEQDAVYYILAAVKTCGNSLQNDEIYLSGDRNRRMPLMQQLRRFAASVMPVVFPTNAFRSGSAALEAPFNMILIPLCE